MTSAITTVVNMMRVEKCDTVRICRPRLATETQRTQRETEAPVEKKQLCSVLSVSPWQGALGRFPAKCNILT